MLGVHNPREREKPSQDGDEDLPMQPVGSVTVRINPDAHDANEAYAGFSSVFIRRKRVNPKSGQLVSRFECIPCSKNFDSLGNAKSHFRGVHAKIKPFKCPTCGKGFSVNSNCKVHIKSQTCTKRMRNFVLSSF